MGLDPDEVNAKQKFSIVVVVSPRQNQVINDYFSVLRFFHYYVSQHHPLKPTAQLIKLSQFDSIFGYLVFVNSSQNFLCWNWENKFFENVHETSDF